MNRLLRPHELPTRQLTPLAHALQAGAKSPQPRGLRVLPDAPGSGLRLLAAEHFDRSVWEPFWGTSWISEELKRVGYRVTFTDLAEYGYGRSGVDFLRQQTPLAKHTHLPGHHVQHRQAALLLGGLAPWPYRPRSDAMAHYRPHEVSRRKNAGQAHTRPARNRNPDPAFSSRN